jgi:hypothetical protein
MEWIQLPGLPPSPTLHLQGTLVAAHHLSLLKSYRIGHRCHLLVAVVAQSRPLSLSRPVLAIAIFKSWLLSNFVTSCPGLQSASRRCNSSWLIWQRGLTAVRRRFRLSRRPPPSCCFAALFSRGVLFPPWDLLAGAASQATVIIDSTENTENLWTLGAFHSLKKRVHWFTALNPYF